MVDGEGKEACFVKGLSHWSIKIHFTLTLSHIGACLLQSGKLASLP